MKQILFLLLGLMSLVGLSSCEDEFTYDDDKNFMPIGYLPKSPTNDDIDDDGNIREITTLQILGMQGLVFDDISKDDWKIITQPRINFKGKEPLKILQPSYEIETNSLVDIGTNYESIPITLGNAKVTYAYMGQELELEPLEDMQIVVKLTDENFSSGKYFLHMGYIEFTLTIGYIPIKRHKISFSVVDPDIYDE